ncbi:MAG: peptidoglycan DD-metalloendopeptidase family protein [Sphingomonadaceae bacterium]
MGHRFLVLAAVALVGGCIPAAPPQQSTVVADIPPKLDAELDTLYDERPVWEMRPVAANATDVRETTYTVAPGDTLRAIGEKTGAGSETIARVNGLTAPFIIRPGQRLAIPGGRFHKVGAGETGIAIAKAYSTSWAKLIELNALQEPFILRLGQRLLLPAEAVPGDQAIEARAAAFRLEIDDILTGGEPATDLLPVATVAPDKPLGPEVSVAVPSGFSGTFIWPANGTLASRFGAVGEGNDNQGIDIAVTQQAPIRASGDGVVAFVGNNVANYGGLILIRHGDGWITAYGRASQASVTRGQKVSRGQIIGRAGTGGAPLLFFQMRKNRIPVDPVKQLPRR